MPTTYTWIGATGTAFSGSDPANWSPAGQPGPGDIGYVLSGGTIQLSNGQFESNTVHLDGGRLIFSGDSGVSLTAPSLDQASTITTNAGVFAQASTLDSLGNFVNDGTILANGVTGSSLLINIGTTTFGTVTAPGYFFNPGLIQANAGNSVTISIGADSVLFNSGQIIANGGTVVINASAAAIAGGYAPALGFVEIGGGGTVETNAGYAPTVTGQTPTYAFLDGTAGNTLIIDNPGSFSGRIFGFGAGDTIDLGSALAIGKAVYSSASGILYLEDAAGTILESLPLATGGFQSGTFTLSGTTLGSFNLDTGVNGHSVLTTNVQIPVWDNSTGTWQTAGSWSGLTVPGSLDTPLIGQGASFPFVLTTGGTPVSVSGFDLVSNNATLQITSDTTTTSQVDGIIGGTLRISNNSTLTATAVRAFTNQSSITIDSGSTLKLTGHTSNAIMSVAGTLAITAGNSIAAAIGAGTVMVIGSLIAEPAVAGGSGGSVVIGLGASGTPASVAVTGGGVVTDSYSLLGSDPNSYGSLTLDGASGGASWTDKVDLTDPSSLRGYMLLGFNSISSNIPGSLTQPPLSHAAELLVTNGATLTEQQGAFIGNTANSAGEATISAGGFWNISVGNVGVLSVGQVGTGSLSVLNGGSVAVGGAGTIVGTSTSAAVAGGIGVGSTAGASGTLIVSGASSSVSTLSGMSVGRAGIGQASVLNGGQINVNGGVVTVGSTAGASGTIVVGGSGAAAMLNFAAGAGGMTVGSAGSGTVSVTDHGTITLNGTGGMTIGSAAGSSGTAIVAGATASAVINIGTRGLTVGGAGNGGLAIGSLGTVALNGTSGIGIGQSAGAIGAVTVDGGHLIEGATASGIGVGQDNGASGTLRVLNGGTVSLAGGGISAGATSTAANGSISVDGAGSLLQLTGTAGMAIGQTGTGTLTVLNNAQVSNANRLTIGQNANSSGFVTVAGATMTANNLSIDADAGLTAQGTLTIGAGGVVNLTNKGTINNHGVIDLQGGILNVSAATTNPGSVLLLNSGALLEGFGQVNLGANDTGVFSATGATIIASGGTLDLSFGTGAMTIAANAALKLATGAGIGASISFSTGGQETLLIGGTIAATNSYSINNWSDNDRIEFANGEVASKAVFSGGTLSVDVTGPVFNGTYQFTNVALGSGQSSTFLTGTDGTTGNSFVQLACFVEGTLIRTANGDVPVEALREGADLIASALTGEYEPVIWVGQTTVDCRAHPKPTTVWPVRIAAGAFGANAPGRDLWLSPDHAIYVNGVLVPVKLLVDGVAITQVPRRRIRYFHIELPRHDVILAEGLAVESYLDAGDREQFASGDTVTRFFSDFTVRLTPLVAAIWEARGAAPLVLFGAALADARSVVTGALRRVA